MTELLQTYTHDDKQIELHSQDSNKAVIDAEQLLTNIVRTGFSIGHTKTEQIQEEPKNTINDLLIQTHAVPLTESPAQITQLNIELEDTKDNNDQNKQILAKSNDDSGIIIEHSTGLP